MNSPTLEDVARAAGVSRATASRVIRGDVRVAPDKVRLVQGAVEKLGYAPNLAARRLVTRRTDAIALLVPEPDTRIFSDPSFAAAVSGVNGALEPTGLQLLLVMQSARGDDRLLDFLSARHADGFVVMSHHQDPRLADALRNAGVPISFIGRPLEDFDAPYADLDNVAGGRLAAERLVARGCRRPATITGPLDMGAAVDRLAGWRQGLAEAGLEDHRVVHGDFMPQSGGQAARDLLGSHPEVDGVFAANDLMALGALAEIRQSGRRVPDDVALIGFDDTQVGAELSVPLTSITNPVRRLAEEATRLLLQALRGEECEPVVLRPEISARASG